MTDDRAFWARVETILAEVEAAPPDRRSRRLDELAGDDAHLRNEVASLLQSGEDLGGFLESSVPDALGGTDAHLGRVVGAYRLEELLGVGGMGAVYRARRIDGAFEHEVAVKLIRDTLTDPDLQRRFRRERQILASLRHPHIARLIDGGVTDAGQPYLAMELIRGPPITEYCDVHRLDLGRRLELFDAVCAAVQHAHGSLVVHRDLKPAHILVDEDGQPRLLDFGIAAMIDDDSSRPDVTVTQAHRFTPQYASPEQVRGLPVTTATDVYALGVILYELLAGRRPYRVAGVSAEEDARTICRTLPPVPSRRLEMPAAADEPTPEAIAGARRLDPARLRRRLRGDLDTIVMTSLRKEPARRYASAEALREDLRRFRDGLPIRARPDTFGYRTRKFLRRHRLPVAASIAVTMALVGGVISTAWQAQRAARGRAEAVGALRASDTVGRFLRSILVAADPREGGRDMSVRQALDQAVARIEAELGSEPAVEARVREAIGMTYRTLGAHEEAEVHLVRAHALAVETMGATSPETARITHELGVLRLDQGRFDEAERLLAEALSMREQVLGANDFATLRSRSALALVYEQLGRSAEALAHVEAVVAARESGLGPEDPATLEAKNNLASVLRSLGRADEAVVLAQEVYRGQVAVLGADHPDTLISANDIGSILSRLERLEEAVPWLERAIAGLSKQYPPGSLDVVIPKRNLADVLGRLGRRQEAIDLSLVALADAEATLGADHYVVGVIRLDLGRQYLALGRAAEAVAHLQPARAVLLAVFGPDDRFTRDAEQALREALEATVGPGDSEPPATDG